MGLPFYTEKGKLFYIHRLWTICSFRNILIILSMKGFEVLLDLALMLWQAQLDGLFAFEQGWVHGAVRGLGRSETAR